MGAFDKSNKMYYYALRPLQPSKTPAMFLSCNYNTRDLTETILPKDTTGLLFTEYGDRLLVPMQEEQDKGNYFLYYKSTVNETLFKIHVKHLQDNSTSSELKNLERVIQQTLYPYQYPFIDASKRQLIIVGYDRKESQHVVVQYALSKAVFKKVDDWIVRRPNYFQVYFVALMTEDDT